MSMKCQTCQRPIFLDTSTSPSQGELLDMKAVLTFPHISPVAVERHNKDIHMIAEYYIVEANSGGGMGPADALTARMQQTEHMDRLLEAAGDIAFVEHPVCTRCADDITKKLVARREELDEDQRTFRDVLCSLEEAEEGAKVQLQARGLPIPDLSQVTANPDGTISLPSTLSSSASSSAASSTAKEASSTSATTAAAATPAAVAVDSALSAEEAALAAETAALEEELVRLWREREAVTRAAAALHAESKALDEHEQRVWSAVQDLELMADTFEARQLSLVEQKKSVEAAIAKAQRMSAFDDVFRISVDGHFGTISGCRLGKIGDAVEWHEVNTGLGQVVLLLETVRKRASVTLSHQLFPMGSYSRIRKPEAEQLNLFRLDSSIGIFRSTTFDEALSALLQCVGELCAVAHKSWPELTMYPIAAKEARINDLSIKFSGQNEALWTRALKYMLTNCKALLVWSERSAGAST